MSSDTTAEGRDALLQAVVQSYDHQWFVDHETTVRRWDEELAAIIDRGKGIARPIDNGVMAIWAVHEVVHELIELQRSGPVSTLYTAVDAWWARQRDLLQMIVLRSLWEAMIWSGHELTSDWDGVPWVTADPCKMVLVGNRELMVSKNKQYGSSWSVQRSSDMTGMMHAKVHRITQLVSGEENTFESIEDSYRDIINYALFCLIRLSMEVTPEQAPRGVPPGSVPGEDAEGRRHRRCCRGDL